MTERLPLSPFEFETDLSDSEFNPYDQLTIDSNQFGGSKQVLWDMTESDDFPNDDLVVSSSSRYTEELDVAIDGKHGRNTLSQEEYSQELNGSTNCHHLVVNSFHPRSDTEQNSMFRPATTLSASSDCSSLNNIFQTLVCPHITYEEELTHPYPLVCKEEISSPHQDLEDTSMMNTTTNPLLFDEETDELTEEEKGDELYDYCSTTSEDSSDLDYFESEKKSSKKSSKKLKRRDAETKPNKKRKKSDDSPKKVKKETKKEISIKKRKRNDHVDTEREFPISDRVKVCEGDVENVYSDSFLKISLDMPGNCKVQDGTAPACKPSLFNEGSEIDTSNYAKFNVTVKASNIPANFDVMTVELVVLSCSDKYRKGEMKYLQKFSDIHGKLQSSLSTHGVLKKDPAGNELLKINSTKRDDSRKEIIFNCSITTSNNHPGWHVKHNYYRVMACSSDNTVMGALSIPFKVAKNASGKSSSTFRVREGNVNVGVNLQGSKDVEYLSLRKPETIFTHGGKKYKVTLSEMEDDE